MKLRNKILTLVAPAAAIATITPIALTSCKSGSADGPTNVTHSGSRQLEITTNSYSLEFTLDKELPQYWTITCGLHGNISGTMITGPSTGGVTTTGKKVTVACGASPMFPATKLKSGDYATFGLTITCRNAEFKDVFKVNFDGFKVTYTGA